jgi:UDP-N-acetylglucosamine 2-epimerase (non-hydrolysing)
MKPLRIVLVAGARPNFMKIAAIIDAVARHNAAARRPITCRLVHTGQHYDERMSSAFFRDLGLPVSDVDLEVGSASHAVQTAEIMKRFEPVLLREQPDVVVVVGDVNSTVACALVAAKIVYPTPTAPGRERPLIAHVEAGLRSFDRAMPEEVNRIVTDALADLLFVTEPSAEENLLREGVPRSRIHFVGNTMVDTLLKHRERARQSSILTRLGLAGAGAGEPGDYAVLTLHRPSNVDEPATFRAIIEALAVVARQLPIVFPTHPRTQSRIEAFGFGQYFASADGGGVTRTPAGRITCLPPVGYLDFLCLMSNARLVLTDSGGIQEETTVLGVPCVTLRENTERPATITHGTNALAGTKTEEIVHQAFNALHQRAPVRRPKLWDGRAGDRIVKVLNGLAL